MKKLLSIVLISGLFACKNEIKIESDPLTNVVCKLNLNKYQWEEHLGALDREIYYYGFNEQKRISIHVHRDSITLYYNYFSFRIENECTKIIYNKLNNKFSGMAEVKEKESYNYILNNL